MNVFEKARIDMMRRVFPMTATWHAKRAVNSLLAVMLAPTEVVRDVTKVAADALQQKVFFSEARA